MSKTDRLIMYILIGISIMVLVIVMKNVGQDEKPVYPLNRLDDGRVEWSDGDISNDIGGNMREP